MRQTAIVTAEQISAALLNALPDIASLGVPRRIPQGFSSESWLVATDRGELLVKVRRQQTDAAKLRSMVEAVRLAREAGVATPDILYAAHSPVIDGRPLVITHYLPGEDAESALPTLDDVQRQTFFSDLGAAIGRIHTVALPAFTERIGAAEGTTGDWAEMERLIVYHGLEQLTMLPNWRQTGEMRLEEYSRRQLHNWLAGHYPDWLVPIAAHLAD